MNETHRLHRALTAVLLLGAAGLMVVLIERFGTSAWSAVSQPAILLWLAMMTVAAMSRLPIPRMQASLSLSVVMDLGALLVFGPAIACVFAFLSRALACTADRWKPVGASLRAVATSVLAVGFAGVVHTILNGAVGRPFSGFGDVLAVAAAAVAYIGVTRLLEPASRVIQTGNHREARRSVRIGAMMDVLLTPFAVLLAMMQMEIGSMAVALFLVPLMFARWAIRAWLATRNGHLETVRMLMCAVDAGDVFTRGHATRISRMSGSIARYLGLPPREVEEIEYAALLHDFGRTAMARDILGKRGRLSDEERAELRAHPQVGHDMVRTLGLFEGAAEIVLSHHEQPDGRGYPRALSGEQIPMGSRIIMAVTAFDAMTSDRPYREGLDAESAFEELLAYSGSQFFPDVVEALIDLYGSGELFAGFSEEELLEYAGDDGNSRVLQSHVRRNGISAGIPAKRGAGARNEPEILELPVPDEPARSEARRFDLGDGRHLDVAGATDVGCLRDNNEDSFGLFGKGSGALLVLADGMGGAAAGEVASALAVDCVSAAFDPDLEATAALERAFISANEEIHRSSLEDTQRAGMGTTCTALYFRDGAFHVGHVGDSRAYRVGGSGVEQLTRDHTLAMEMERLAGVGNSIAGSDHVLTRCLGTDASVQVDASEEALSLDTGDLLILCSDGLSNLVAAEELRSETDGMSPEAACMRLIELARERGGPDNITVIAARVESDR